MDYYLTAWSRTKEKSKQKIVLNPDLYVYRFCRNYDGKCATFYTTTSWFVRDMYIYLGSFLEKVVLSYQEVCEKCTSKSVKRGFRNCPTLFLMLNTFQQGNNESAIVKISTQKGACYCLRYNYSTLFERKRRVFRDLCGMVDDIRKELSLIDKSAFEIRKTFGQKMKSLFGKSVKYIVRAGVIVLAAAVGANFDLPDFDFDFDIDVPDVPDISDVDFDVDVPDMDIQEGVPEIPEDLAIDENSYNVSFGANNENELENLQKKLEKAQENINYYNKQLNRTDISKTYENNCTFKLEQAINELNKIERMISRLTK